MNHPRIVHLCNAKEVFPSKRLNSKVLIYIFYLFLSWFHNSPPHSKPRSFNVPSVVRSIAINPTAGGNIACPNLLNISIQGMGGIVAIPPARVNLLV